MGVAGWLFRGVWFENQRFKTERGIEFNCQWLQWSNSIQPCEKQRGGGRVSSMQGLLVEWVHSDFSLGNPNTPVTPPRHSI